MTSFYRFDFGAVYFLHGLSGKKGIKKSGFCGMISFAKVKKNPHVTAFLVSKDYNTKGEINNVHILRT